MDAGWEPPLVSRMLAPPHHRENGMAAKKKSAAKKKTTTSELRRNDKKKLILRLVKGNADIKAREIIDALKKKGVTVTSNYVYKVLNAGKETTPSASPKAKGSSAPVKSSSSSDAKAAFTRAVQDLGVARARKLLDILAKLEQA
jgi:hypothetical protein